jgi:hypothetical protein
VVDDAALDDVVGLGEAGLEVAAAQRPLADLVGAELRVHEREPSSSAASGSVTTGSGS